MRELKTGRHLLCQGKDPKKDQSYVLYTVTQGVLSHLLLPCGEYTKEEIRRFAAESGLPVAKKPDSQDICFVPDGDYAAFIRRYTGEAQPEGWFVDREGNPLGKHRGIGCYTIGQRKGLGIALGRPMFVQAIDPEKNTVTLVEDESLLYSRQVIAGDVNFLSLPKEEFYQLLPVRARVRYSQGLAEAQAASLMRSGCASGSGSPSGRPRRARRWCFTRGIWWSAAEPSWGAGGKRRRNRHDW